jgi:MFS superfamily sulfate permease-like transporter
VVDSSGGRTQVVTVVASMVVLSVMLWFTTLLEYLPKVI